MAWCFESRKDLSQWRNHGIVGIQWQNHTQGRIRTVGSLWKEMKGEPDWIDNVILHTLYCSWISPKKKKWAQVEWKSCNTSVFWNNSLSILSKEGNVHSFYNDLLKTGDMNARLTQNNWIQITRAKTQRNILLCMVINQFFFWALQP